MGPFGWRAWPPYKTSSHSRVDPPVDSLSERNPNEVLQTPLSRGVYEVSPRRATEVSGSFRVASPPPVLDPDPPPKIGRLHVHRLAPAINGRDTADAHQPRSQSRSAVLDAPSPRCSRDAKYSERPSLPLAGREILQSGGKHRCCPSRRLTGFMTRESAGATNDGGASPPSETVVHAIPLQDSTHYEFQL